MSRDFTVAEDVVSDSMTSFRSVSRHPSAPQGSDVPQHRSAVLTQPPQQGQ